MSCKAGVQTRKRSCNDPSPAHGGRKCIGASLLTHTCNLGPCPVNGGWSSWNSWSTCQKTCGGGTQTRYRYCNHPPPQHNGKTCTGQKVMSQSCNTDPCPLGTRLVLCERGHMGTLIRCGLFRRIRIHWVHYGYISGESACGITHTQTCSAPNAYHKLRMWCEGKRLCFVKPWNKLFRAPCGGNRRYLKLYYSCM